ncbi:MAG TPA: TonB-dependent receptor, partial [Gemmatimonadaceae bacterium]|nr:TonB-dependent receptor [Gemmatimonadaceae bacterium]
MEDTQGADPDNNLNRYSGRANLSVMPSPKFDMSLSMGYTTSDTELPAEAGFGGRVWTTILADARNLFNANGTPSPRRGFHSGLPEQYSSVYEFGQGVNRFTGSLSLNHQPLSWLRHRLTAGTDLTKEDNSILFRRVEDSLTKVSFGTEALGYREINNRAVNFYTLDYSANGTRDIGPSLRSVTSVGAQYYRNSTTFHFSCGSIFPTPGLTALSATTLPCSSSSGDVLEDATLGFFGQQQLGWRERLFLTAALRADDNSAFGKNFDRVYYPKYSMSYVVSEEPFWRWSAINALKLRAAYGESGKQPATFSALQTYTTATGPGDVATVTPQFIGNADLGPERAKELEFGFDLGALGDRVGIEFTSYRRNITDAILDREIPPSTGVPGTQPFNAGRVRNWGSEVMFRVTPVRRDNVDWNSTLGYSRNNSKIISLGTSQAILDLRRANGTPDFVSAGSFVRHQVGYPIGSYFEKRVVAASLAPNGTVIPNSVMCDDGAGGAKLCAGADLRYGTADDAPAVFIGTSLPRGEGSFGNTLSLWNKLRLYALLDFKRDYYKVDGNTRVRCTFFGNRCRENFYPGEYDPKRIAAIQSSRNLVDFFINNAGYTKLREVSVGYTLPETMAGRVGFNRAVVTLAGRNLRTWTKYPGLEPEAFFLGGARGGNFGQWEQTTMPQLTQWILSLNLDW